MLRFNMMSTVALFALMSTPITGVAAAVASNEVCVYQYSDYINKLGCFSLKPGMRQVLVPRLGKGGAMAQSIHVGKDVEAMVFTGLEFRNQVCGGDVLQDLCMRRGSNRYLQFKSLIVAPRQQGKDTTGVKGISLTSNSNTRLFLPLPEYLKDTESHFELTGTWNDHASYLNFFGEVEAVLFKDHHFKGAHVTVPGSGFYDAPPGSSPRVWQTLILKHFGLSEELSSVKVRDIHALKAIKMPIKRPLTPPERGGQTSAPAHRAPPAQGQYPVAPQYPGPAGAIPQSPSIKPSVPLVSLITGNTLKVSIGVEGVSWSIYFRPDNKVFARSNQGKQDSGGWWIKGNAYCTQYQHLNNNKRSCYSLTREGDQFHVYRAESGQQVGIAEIMPGNPQQLDQPGSGMESEPFVTPPEATAPEATPIPLP